MGIFEEGRVCYIERLPSELKLKIIENVSGRDVMILECVSTEWKRLSPSDDFWKKICYADETWSKMWGDILFWRFMMIKRTCDDEFLKKICALKAQHPFWWKKMRKELMEADSWNEMLKRWKELFILWNTVRKDKYVYDLCLYAAQFYVHIDYYNSNVGLQDSLLDLNCPSPSKLAWMSVS